jgi:VWFA-related protein
VRRSRWLLTVAFVCLPGFLSPATHAQTGSVSPAGQNGPEITTHDEPATFRTTTNLVMVPVVVRDGQGHPVGDLKQVDFQLFDRGKLQVISKFSVEKHEAAAAPPAPPESAAAPTPKLIYPSAVPERFFAYLFDDINMQVGDLGRVRDAAAAHIAKNLGPKDRAAVFTTSGQIMLDFTGDPDKLHDTLYRLLLPKPLGGGARTCPDIPYIQARHIRDNDSEARYFGLWETIGCFHLTLPGDMQLANAELQGAVGRIISLNEQSARNGLTSLSNAVRRISVMPGQRTVVLVSPGFLSSDFKQDETEIIDRAIHSNVVINSLDARALYTENRDASRKGITVVHLADPVTGQVASVSDFLSYQETNEHQTANLQADVLAEVAYGTGGTFFHNNNDFAEGFRRVASVPEYSYVLGFSPQDMKFDGSFHALKVTLKNHGVFDIDARRGYSAPKSISDPAEVAKEQIREALFSRDEIHDFPIELHTEYFKTGQSARLSLVAHIDLKSLKFRKEEGRNHDDLTVVAGLFDHNGNYVAGTQQGVNLRLLDGNMERWLRSGITVPASFEVKPGAYLLRLVVRDSTGPLMAAHNGVVEIP